MTKPRYEYNRSIQIGTDSLYKELRSTMLEGILSLPNINDVIYTTGYLEIIKILLLEHQPPVDYIRILNNACNHDYIDIVNFLLENNLVNDCNRTNLLIYSVQYAHVEMTQLLLSDKEVELSEEICMIDMTCESGNPELVKLLLLHPRIDIAVNSENPMFIALENDNLPIVNLLLTIGNIEHISIDDLETACYTGNVTLVKLLLNDHRFTMNEDDKRNCHIIDICSSYLELIRLLLSDDRFDPTNNDNEALYSAVTNDDGDSVEIMKMLLSDPRIDPTGYPLIEIACKHGNIKMVKLLLVDPRIDPQFDDNLALHSALKHERYAITKLILSDIRGSSTINIGWFTNLKIFNDDITFKIILDYIFEKRQLIRLFDLNADVTNFIIQIWNIL